MNPAPSRQARHGSRAARVMDCTRCDGNARADVSALDTLPDGVAREIGISQRKGRLPEHMQ